MGATLTTLADLIVEIYAAPWVDALKKNVFFLTRLNGLGGVKTGKGNDIKWPVRYAGNSAVGSYGENEAAAGANNQDAKKASLTWRYNRAEIGVSGQALAVGVGGMVTDPLRFEIDNGLIDLQDVINTQLMSDGTGNSAKDITGFRAGIADSGVYAGIDRGSYTWWKSYVNANGGTDRNLTEKLMEVCAAEVEDRGGKVTAVWTGSKQWHRYGDLLRAERRQTNPTTLTGGYQALDYEGIPLIKVPGYPAKRMDFVDERMFEYHMLPVTSENAANIQGLREVVAFPGVPGFGVLILGAVKDAIDFWIIHYSQLVVRNTYRLASLQDLAE